MSSIFENAKVQPALALSMSTQSVRCAFPEEIIIYPFKSQKYDKCLKPFESQNDFATWYSSRHQAPNCRQTWNIR